MTTNPVLITLFTTSKTNLSKHSLICIDLVRLKFKIWRLISCTRPHKKVEMRWSSISSMIWYMFVGFNGNIYKHSEEQVTSSRNSCWFEAPEKRWSCSSRCNWYVYLTTCVRDNFELTKVFHRCITFYIALWITLLRYSDKSPFILSFDHARTMYRSCWNHQWARIFRWKNNAFALQHLSYKK